MKRQFKKYEFNTKSTATKYINELYVDGERKTYLVDSVDENGDTIQIEKPYIAHVVVLGFLPIEQAEYDSEGNVTKEAVLSEKYSVDVMWESEIEDRWNTYEIEVEVSSHKFA
jgi:hypothetical protein